MEFAQPLLAADELASDVADHRAGQQMRLAQDLEPVADAEHRQAALGGPNHLTHDRREPGDRTGAQVIAVTEAAGQDDRIHIGKRIGCMPQRDRFGPGQSNRPPGVLVVQRAREGDHADPAHC